MNEAKEEGREGYRERVREREGNRERGGEWEKKREIHTIWEGSINGPSIRGKVGLTENLMIFCDLQWPLRSYFFKWNINIGIHIIFYQNRFINESVRKNFLKFP